MTAAIEIHGLSKSYGQTRALSDLELEVRPGEVFGFLGPNGAGKTTTIRLLLALQRPTAGRLLVFGLDPGRAGPELHRRIGYLPGDLELYPRMTAREHIEWFARVRGGDALRTAHGLVERLDVVADRPVRELSKGNRQKVGLVLAFMHGPELLILDEPTSGLDPLMQNEFERLVREAAGEGRTVFLSSHELDEVQRLADRVAIVRAGRLVATDTVQGLRRGTPEKLDVRFSSTVDPAAFAALAGVTVTSCEQSHMTLEVTEEIGPVLTLIASHDPLELIARRATLDELFLEYYRGEPGDGLAEALEAPETSDAR